MEAEKDRESPHLSRLAIGTSSCSLRLGRIDIKCIAAASLGAGAPVGVVAGSWAVVPIAAASIGAKALGTAEVNAQAGDILSVRLDPAAFL